MNIESMPLTAVLRMVHKKNPKNHATADIAESFRRFGFVHPLTIDEATATLVAGHGRAETLRMMRDGGQVPPHGIVSVADDWMVPVIRGVRFETEHERDAYLLADNQLAIAGGWNPDALADMLRDLDGFDVGMEGIGFDDFVIGDLLAGGGREVDVDGHTRIIGAGGDEEEDIDRDTWCTPKWITAAIGTVDLDPCANERSHVQAARTFCLDIGQDGLALALGVDPETKTFINPPYSNVMPWVEGYGHTRFCFLLKFDPSTKWFAALMAKTALVLIPKGTRVQFEAPPGVPAEKTGSNPFPHALFFARAIDASQEIRKLCMEMPTGAIGGKPTDKDWASALGTDGDGSDPSIQQKSFVLTIAQIETVSAAIARAKEGLAENPDNQNSNGNALAAICSAYMEHLGG